MDPQKERSIEQLLKENIRLTRDNNRLVRKLWKAQVLNFWSRILFFVLIIGIPVIVYQYYLSDTVGQLKDAYTDFRSNLLNLGDTADKVLR